MTPTETENAGLVIDPDLIRKYERAGPRYTSYPTADRFIEAYGADAHQTTLATRNLAGVPQPLSLYVHVPFCNTVCYYCGCNKIVTRNHGHATQYLSYLAHEIKLTAEQLAGHRRVEQLHLGGGTPTFLSLAEIQQLLQDISRHFELAPGEYSIEIDPRTVDSEKMRGLAALGFNRISLGVQDFDPAVQQAVNRIQSEAETAAVIDAARAAGITSVNLDLIYGLPKQHVIGFSHTLDRVIALKPDRIALYSYAHLPDIFKTQRQINANDLPSAEARLQIMTLAIRKLTGAGYVYIGMDHFALPHDELAIAAKQARLHRNFQGYSTRPDCDLLAFGVSAISKVGATYSQNVKTLDEYYDCLDRGVLPILRGIELTADDLLRRTVIQSLMCHFALSLEAVEIAHLVQFREYFAAELQMLETMAAEGLVELEDDWITVTPRGRLLVRVIAMVFDRHFMRGQQRERFSKVI
ncbi:MAG: oxygen-independent coproporphyrinogen III oxidase [Betaproteobacteria bacterium]|nr:oxygen-independent coproporphyrinogen III oxidase [Betaproteobacteria bacterium]